MTWRRVRAHFLLHAQHHVATPMALGGVMLTSPARALAQVFALAGVVCSNPPKAMCVVLAKRGLLGTLCLVATLHRQGPSPPLIALQSVPEQWLSC